jgi:hypothetical protein
VNRRVRRIAAEECGSIDNDDELADALSWGESAQSDTVAEGEAKEENENGNAVST